MNGDFHLTKSSGLHFRKFPMGNGKYFQKLPHEVNLNLENL